MLKNKKQFTLLEVLITIPLVMILVFIVSNFIVMMFNLKEKTTADLQRININTVLNLNHGALVCYYSSIGAEEVGLDANWVIKHNEKDIWLLNNGNSEWENETCEILKATLKKEYWINPTGEEDTRLLKHFFLIRTQALNVYTYKLVLAFAIDEDKSDIEHIQRWNNRKDGWYEYGRNLLQIYSINYIGNILKIGNNYNASAGNAVDSLIKRIKNSWDLESANYDIYEGRGETVQKKDFGYSFNRLNFNLIDDVKIDPADNTFPYNQIMLQASYKNWDYSYTDYYAYKNGE